MKIRTARPPIFGRLGVAPAAAEPRSGAAHARLGWDVASRASRRFRRAQRWLAWLALSAFLLPLAAQQAAPPPGLGRSVHGVVLDARNLPLAEAIVYLKNDRTKAVTTVITDNQGRYSFHQLQPHIQYDLFAVWQRRRSLVRTDSQYETASDLRLDLTVPVQ